MTFFILKCFLVEFTSSWSKAWSTSTWSPASALAMELMIFFLILGDIHILYTLAIFFSAFRFCAMSSFPTMEAILWSSFLACSDWPVIMSHQTDSGREQNNNKKGRTKLISLFLRMDWEKSPSHYRKPHLPELLGRWFGQTSLGAHSLSSQPWQEGQGFTGSLLVWGEILTFPHRSLILPLVLNWNSR